MDTDLMDRPDGEERATATLTRPIEGPTPVKDMLAQMPSVGDDGLRWMRVWETPKTIVGAVERKGEDGKWRYVRTMVYITDFVCVKVEAWHACKPRPAQDGDLEWEDNDESPGHPSYERWHLGTHKRVRITIEEKRADEVRIPTREDVLTTTELLQLERQWIGAPSDVPNN